MRRPGRPGDNAARTITPARRLARVALQFLLPDSCVSCGVPLGAAERHLCGPCRSALAPSHARLVTTPGGPVGEIHYALPFEPPTSDVVRALKYGGRVSLAAELAAAMRPAALALARRGLDCATPVPLHPMRRRERGFNQSLLLARRIGTAVGLPLVEGLRRIRPTRSQTELPLEDRRRNVAGAFAGTGGLRGRSVLLVDDVATTGATLLSAAGAAIEDGASAVVCLAAAGRAGGAAGRPESG